jgi:hypothetical protein
MNTRSVAKVMVGCFVAVVVLGMANVMTAGTKHVEVVVTNKQLKQENGKLKEENSVLRTSTQAAAAELQVADSLVKTLAQKDSTLRIVEEDMNEIKQQLEHEKRNSITSPYNTTPYTLEPVEIPGPENN